MKKTLLLLLLLLGAMPALVLAAGGHIDGHDMKSMPGQGMSGIENGSATGRPGDAVNVSRTVDIVMDDTMRFHPGQIQVRPGETVRFLLKNAGKIPHEMMIGSTAELKEHAAMMRNMPGMNHAEPNVITLDPGQKGDMIWQFPQTGIVDFACLVPGHMEAGMIGKIKIQ
ncbi:cupredoxin family protein [Paralcaligenes sp. KSB-10]|jgi:uncharacterized cupredoxin-like copper-binding protein|uniref:cupredoxin domain-containing protein n=1 Tax=Paralcaligenes sp. KSB-10 TaxID=2901142 RepID=UPI001E4C6C81|nr:cupredoxin family protein [Paralcaligenes sp. KSB-10]UHL64790.1 cupredoxin family protein [Paralcaligenes sp. KSB-10]